MDGAAPKAKLHPPRRARAPCARVAEGSGASARHRGKEPQMFAVASGVNAEGKGGASGLGEGPEGCIGGVDRRHLLRISTDHMLLLDENRNSGNDKLNWVSEHLPTSGVNFGKALCSDPPGPAFPSMGDATSSQKRGESFLRENEE